MEVTFVQKKKPPIKVIRNKRIHMAYVIGLATHLLNR